MPDAKSTVLVIDDDPDLRASVGRLLRSLDLDTRLFASVSDFLKSDPPNGPACLVLDVRLPGQSGLDFQRELAGANAKLPIIFITGHGDIPSSVRAIRAGALDFLTKPWRAEQLLALVNMAIDQDREHRAEQSDLERLRRRFESLTPREREVLPLVVGGLLNKQAAAHLGISEITLQIHRTNVMRKMAADSLADLVRMAARLDIPVTFNRRM